MKCTECSSYGLHGNYIKIMSNFYISSYNNLLNDCNAGIPTGWTRIQMLASL